MNGIRQNECERCVTIAPPNTPCLPPQPYPSTRAHKYFRRRSRALLSRPSVCTFRGCVENTVALQRLKEKLQIFASCPPPPQPAPPPMASPNVPEWSPGTCRLKSRHGVSLQHRLGGRSHRTSTFQSVEPDLRIVAIRGVTATTATGSTDAGDPDVGRHDAGDYDYTRRHPGSPDFDNQDSVPYPIKHGSPDLESSDSRKDVGKKSNRECDDQRTDTCDCGENQEAGLKDKGSHEIANKNINREKASRQTRKSPNIDYYENTSRHMRTQPYHNNTVGSASHDRHGFDLSLQPDDEKISTFLQRANVEIGTLRPGDPILDTDNRSSARSSEGHSVGERSSSSSCSICSTPRDRNSSCGEDIGGGRTPTQLSDNFDLEKLDLCSESSNTVEPSSREDVYRQTECNMWEDDRPSDVSTCRLPELATTSNERGSPGDSSTHGDVGLQSTWWQRRSGGEGGMSANCSLPSIDERQSVAMQGKDGRHSVMATYRAGSHSVTAQDKNGRHYVTVQDKAGQHSVTVQNKDSRHYDTAQDKDGQHSVTAQNKDSRHYDTAQDKDGRHSVTVQDKHGRYSVTVQDKDGRLSVTFQDKKDRHSVTAQDKDGRHYVTTPEKNGLLSAVALDKDGRHSFDQVTGLTDTSLEQESPINERPASEFGFSFPLAPFNSPRNVNILVSTLSDELESWLKQATRMLCVRQKTTLCHNSARCSQTNASTSVDVFRGPSPGAYTPCPPLRRRVRRRCQQLVAAPSRIAGLATMPPPILFPAVPTHRSANKLDDAKKNNSSVPAMRHVPMSRLIRRGMMSRGPSRPEVTDRHTNCLRQVSNWNVVSCERARKTRLRTALVGRVNVKFHISELAKPPLWTQPTRIGRN